MEIDYDGMSNILLELTGVGPNPKTDSVELFNKMVRLAQSNLEVMKIHKQQDRLRYAEELTVLYKIRDIIFETFEDKHSE